MILEDVAAFIGDVGFPIAITVFVLWRMNGKMDRLTKALDELKEALHRHTETYRNGGKDDTA